MPGGYSGFISEKIDSVGQPMGVDLGKFVFVENVVLKGLDGNFYQIYIDANGILQQQQISF